ncbi:spore coat U domain-containing protein [Sulfurimonas diazotrophicus]|uniref:Spore coat U domain-containing protein n=1 Tax=Sulfurimonas diazotrophicus TaxID=3131939 RepID=A0ABZ3H9V6_9BACT
MRRRQLNPLGPIIAAALVLTASAAAATCSVSSTGLAFGSYNPFDLASVTTTGTITIQCTTLKLNDRVQATLLLSTGSSNSYSARTMQNDAAETLAYNIYTSSNYALVWGDGNSGTEVVSDKFFAKLLAPATKNYTMYARIPAGQDAGVGTYQDVITVTVEY